MKVAIVHDYLAEYGGAERVVEAISRAFPDAPIYVGFIDWQRLGAQGNYFKNKTIKTTWLQYFPFIKKIYSPLRLLAPSAFATLNLQKYDVVISSTNAYFAKNLKIKSGAKHFCYCHTPARSLYGYSTKSNWRKNPLISFFGKISNHFLRITDFISSQQVTHFLANSREVQQRITKFYRRDSTILYPPAQLATTKKTTITQNPAEELPFTLPANYYLYVNRLGFAKHPELAIEACVKLKRPLVVVGDGAMRSELENKYAANSLITFCGSVNDEILAQLYQHAHALLYPVANEDFGIVPVEAMLAGVPVIAHASGGPLETIIKSKTGVFFTGDIDDIKAAPQNIKNLCQAILSADKIAWNQAAIKKHAAQFSLDNFISNLQKIVKNTSHY